MVMIRQTSDYEDWFDDLKDIKAKARIDIRIQRLAGGNAGDAKAVGDGVIELRIDYGPGYRVYYCQRAEEILLLLIGGNKSTQQKDIRRAKTLLKTCSENLQGR